MGELMGALSFLALTALMIFGIIYLEGPYWDKLECEKHLPRNVECTYQPPATTAPEAGEDV